MFFGEKYNACQSRPPTKNEKKLYLCTTNKFKMKKDMKRLKILLVLLPSFFYK